VYRVHIGRRLHLKKFHKTNIGVEGAFPSREGSGGMNEKEGKKRRKELKRLNGETRGEL